MRHQSNRLLSRTDRNPLWKKNLVFITAKKYILGGICERYERYTYAVLDADSKASKPSTKSSIASLTLPPPSDALPCPMPGSEGALILVGTRGVPRGSNPGAILLSASRFLRSLSSSRARRSASRRAACAAIVWRLDDSNMIICGSSVNGYINCEPRL